MTHMQQSFDSRRFREALGAFTTGLTIVTALDASGADIGVTANSFNSVSLSPPMVLWSLARTSTNFDAFIAARHFAVHVLAIEQDALAALFSRRGSDRFTGLNLLRGESKVALLDGCVARFECHTAFQYEGGDHVIFVGEVLSFEHWDREPLVFKRGRFAHAVHK
jgi:3-hydroxy-9,10-secoandrosta-1,3,5(10)-triene-9,17-dione monooxygenase reductase component